MPQLSAVESALVERLTDLGDSADSAGRSSADRATLYHALSERWHTVMETTSGTMREYARGQWIYWHNAASWADIAA